MITETTQNIHGSCVGETEYYNSTAANSNMYKLIFPCIVNILFDAVYIYILVSFIVFNSKQPFQCNVHECDVDSG